MKALHGARWEVEYKREDAGRMYGCALLCYALALSEFENLRSEKQHG